MNRLKKFLFIPEFLLYYFLQLTLANLSLLKQIFYPSIKGKTVIREVPEGLKSNSGLLILTNLISMSPGTLILDISDDKKLMKIHTLSDWPDVVTDRHLMKYQKKIEKIIL
jgi:multicomponent Na+:H+ antiporter subunit E